MRKACEADRHHEIKGKWLPPRCGSEAAQRRAPWPWPNRGFSRFVTSSTALTATGWSESCRVVCFPHRVTRRTFWARTSLSTIQSTPRRGAPTAQAVVAGRDSTISRGQSIWTETHGLTRRGMAIQYLRQIYALGVLRRSQVAPSNGSLGRQQ